MFREAAEAARAADGRERPREPDEPKLFRPQVLGQDVLEGKPDPDYCRGHVQPSNKGKLFLKMEPFPSSFYLFSVFMKQTIEILKLCYAGIELSGWLQNEIDTSGGPIFIETVEGIYLVKRVWVIRAQRRTLFLVIKTKSFLL